MEYKVNLQLPTPQNFIILQIPGIKYQRQDGFKPHENTTIPIESLSQEQAEEYAEQLKQQFLSHYMFKKTSNPLLQKKTLYKWLKK